MMEWKPSASLETLQKRAQLLADIRAFFSREQVLEVETPALSQAANTDPYIESFSLDHQQRFLHTSPEYAMKRLLASGSGDIYQIAKVWRKEEVSRRHNPEFTLLEWYRVGFSYHQLMREVELLLTPLLTLTKQAKFYSYQQLFIEFLHINPHTSDHSCLISCVKQQVPQLEITDEANWQSQALLDVLLTHCLEPKFDPQRLTFLYDYPVTQSALARVRVATETTVAVAERFEVYMGAMELGNGYQELLNADENEHVFDVELTQRLQQRQPQYPKDQHFLDAMQSGMPFTSGVALGIDRLLMCQLKKEKIEQVISFPWDTA